jgi:hypothetical protein
MKRLPIRRVPRAILLVAVALAVAACAPSVTVSNRTTFVVRVVITTSAGSQVFSPSPGETSVGEAGEGSYRVSVIPDAEWSSWAAATRAYLNERLADSANLTGAQLLEVIQRLKDIATKMKSYEAAGIGSVGCSGAVSNERDGLVTVTQGADGKLIASCK